MRTVPFKSVLEGAAAQLKIEPDAFIESSRALAVQYLNERLREAWHWDFWPELMECEQRAFRPYWDEETLFAVGNIVFYEPDGEYYQANPSPNDPQDGESPAVYPAKWTRVTDFRKYVALDQEGETAIGEVLGVYLRDPRTRGINPGRIDFKITSDGIQPLTGCDARVWVEFRRRPSEFSLVPFDSGAAAVARSIVYSEEDGECYKAIVAVPPGSELTDTVYWEKVPFPAFLSSFVKKAVAADMLSSEGQDARADRLERRAWEGLQQTHDHIFAGQQQFSRAQVQTY